MVLPALDSRTGSLLAVAAGLISVLALSAPRVAAQRPRFGGMLRVELASPLSTLDPGSDRGDPGEVAARVAVLPLIFETLVRAGADGLEPGLADSWQSDPQERQWQFRLRRDVTLHDGTLLTAAHVASALRDFDPDWVVREAGDGVRIESALPLAGLPWELAEPRRAIAVPGADGSLLGTGPFRVDRWEAGRRLVLAANDNYRAGRPFVDAVQVDLARSLRDTVVDLEVGRADIVAVPAQDVRRLSQRGLRVVASKPVELIALVFDDRRPAAANDRTRRAVALAVDTAAICNVLLQRQAQPAAGILPDWLSGYAGLFEAPGDRAAARAAVAALPVPARTLSLGYPAGDGLGQAIADRVAVDARDAGLAVTVAPSPARPSHAADVRLVRVPLQPTTVERALSAVIDSLGIEADNMPPANASAEAIFRYERSVLDHGLVVPLVHLRHLYGLGGRVETTNALLPDPSGALALADVWLRRERP